MLSRKISNNKKHWNSDKRRCECKELIEKSRYNKRFIWISSNCEFECGKSSDVKEYLDYGNSKCREKLVEKLVA